MSTSRSAEMMQAPLQPGMAQVLVVEDERRLRDVLIANIREMGLEPTGVGSAEQAVGLLEKTTFPIVLLDLNLPGLSGMELCALIHRRWPATQAIVLTGYGDLSAAQRAIRLDVVDFLTKPCGMDDLEVALARARARFRERWIASQPAANLPREPRPALETRRPPTPVKAEPVPAPAPAATASLEDVERDLIYNALTRHAGNREAAAAELGISVRKLYYRLHQYQQAKTSVG